MVHIFVVCETNILLEDQIFTPLNILLSLPKILEPKGMLMARLGQFLRIYLRFLFLFLFVCLLFFNFEVFNTMSPKYKLNEFIPNNNKFTFFIASCNEF